MQKFFKTSFSFVRGREKHQITATQNVIKNGIDARVEGLGGEEN
jgi:hypothetical protein